MPTAPPDVACPGSAPETSADAATDSAVTVAATAARFLTAGYLDSLASKPDAAPKGGQYQEATPTCGWLRANARRCATYARR